MTTSEDRVPGGTAVGAAPLANPKRWTALVFICLAQLMVVLDITIVNIALPEMQADLAFSSENRQWVVTSYTLAFGSLLLLGGRIADYTGRKRAFVIALAGFALASCLGGAAGNIELLLTARALQGVFGALLAPTALSLISVNFTDQKERAKAFSIFGGIVASGAVIGLLLGGLLTEYLDWRWCMYVNAPIAVIAAFGVLYLGPEQRAAVRARFDIPGVLLVTSGLVSIVYACSEAESEGWGSGLVLGLFALGALLLLAFVAVESRSSHPLLPLRVITDRTRGSAYLAVGVAMIAMLGALFFLTFYLQLVKGYSPVETGLAFLPLPLGVGMFAGGLSTKLIPKAPPRALVVPGMLIASCALFWLAALEPDSSYWAMVMPALYIQGAGMGLVIAPAMNYATYRIADEDAGVASGSVNTAQQIGGSIGTALLSTLAADAASEYLAERAAQGKDPAVVHAAMTEGFTTAFTWAAVIMVFGAVIIAALMNTPKPNPGEVEGSPMAHMG
ncbi:MULTISPECIES: MFS transporter [unclassified Streptomyces]|uniref:MFS transporter n=1 Tax=unclassified Streptomyces TaxID=2593676 RepID=UPI001661D51C|nr:MULTISPECIES: MFS transporter [unclassified Streptomyces]MBD0838235.1 MFS transporter [Streptomyces sp. TRM68416]